MSSKLVDLGEIAEFINGYAFKPTDWSNTGIKIIRIQNLTSGEKSFNRTSKSVPDKYLVKKGDILVSWSATLDVFEWSEEEDALLNQHIFLVKPFHDRISKKYFKYALGYSIAEMSNFTHGSTMKHIVRKDFLKHKIPLPTIEEQNRIVKVLDLAQSLIEKRKQAIAYLDNYIKAVFLDMFGDPVSNPKGWERSKLGDLVSEFRYGTNTISDTKQTDLKLPILRIPNIIGEKISYHDLKYSTVDDKEKEKIKLMEGDLLFVRSNGNPAYIGRCAVFEGHFECGYASYLIRVRLKNDENRVSPQLIRDVINFPTYRRLVLEKAKTTAGNYNINIESLKSLKIIVPPFKLQDSLISISKRTESLKQKMQAQLQELEDNFQVQLQRAFRGE